MGVKDTCKKIIHTMELLEPAVRTPHGITGKGGHSRLPFSEKLLEHKTNLKATLTSWALMLAEEEHLTIDCTDTITGITHWLSRHADHLDTHPAAPDFHQEVRDIVTAIHTHLNPTEWEYCGEWNGIAIRVPRGQKTVTYPNGETRLVETIKKQRRRKTLDYIGTAREVADTLTIIHHVKVTAKQIMKWYEHDKRKRSRGLLQPSDGLNDRGMSGAKPLFKVDDVLMYITCADRVQTDTLKAG